MPAHERQRPPSGHGEVLTVPPAESWAVLATENSAAVAAWPESLRELRADARAETLACARVYTRAIGVDAGGSNDGPVIMTGHQPELFGPGVWAKHFLVQRVAREVGGVGLEVVVDTDVAESISLRTPCLREGVAVCDSLLVRGDGGAYVQTGVPDEASRSSFRASGLASLGSLPAPSLARHFTSYCEALDEAAVASHDLGTLMTAARRRYERPAGTDYLDVLASEQVRMPSYLRFVATLLLDAGRFRESFNRALARYRALTGARSAAQPFPDLAIADGRVEVPFWLLADGRRVPVFVDESGGLYAGDALVALLGTSVDSVAGALEDTGSLLAPRAITLTLFERLFVADLFVHGTGGGRYDRVTDDVMREYFGIEPPAFAVASMTLLLPLGACIVTDEDVSAAERRLKRFEHNPDELLSEVEFDTPAERARAEELAGRKSVMVRAIGEDGADRKTLGLEIKRVNAELAALLGPIGRGLKEALDRARDERDASAVLTDRTYPFCLWDPVEVMDKVG